MPVTKAAFPLRGRDPKDVASALRVRSARTCRSLPRSSYTLDELIADVVAALERRHGRAARVHKLRRHYTLGGCMAELTDVRADGASTPRTIAIESPDPARVIAAVREAGLADRNQNTSFPRRAPGGRSSRSPRGPHPALCRHRRRARTPSSSTSASGMRAGRGERVVDRSEVTRLGEGLDASLAGFVPGADGGGRPYYRRHGGRGGAKLGVARGSPRWGRLGLRAAQKQRRVRHQLAVARALRRPPIEVISGEEEARLAYRAATAGLGRTGGRGRRVRLRRRQLAVHLRPRRITSTSCFSVEGPRRAPSPSATASTALSWSEQELGRREGRHRHLALGRLDGPPVHRTPSSRWAAR